MIGLTIIHYKKRRRVQNQKHYKNLFLYGFKKMYEHKIFGLPFV